MKDLSNMQLNALHNSHSAEELMPIDDYEKQEVFASLSDPNLLPEFEPLDKLELSIFCRPKFLPNQIADAFGASSRKRK